MTKTSFRKELRRQTRLAIGAAIGFIIAFAWKDFIIGLVGDSFGRLVLVMPNLSRFLTALLLTVIGVILILISSKILE